MTATTRYIREQADGSKIEYRRKFGRPSILDLECRVLRADGTPHDETWHVVSDGHLMRMQQSDEGRAIVQQLDALTE